MFLGIIPLHLAYWKQCNRDVIELLLKFDRDVETLFKSTDDKISSEAIGSLSIANLCSSDDDVSNIDFDSFI